jgi:hypothetical protein
MPILIYSKKEKKYEPYRYTGIGTGYLFSGFFTFSALEKAISSMEGSKLKKKHHLDLDLEILLPVQI